MSIFYKKIGLILFGLCLSAILLEIGLRIGGFAILYLQEHRNRISIKQKGAYRIMCIGESTTQNQYPPYLEEILNQRDIGMEFSVIDKGLGSTNTTAILARLESDLDKYKPDMVIAMMGINDGGSYIPYDISADSKKQNFFRFFKIYKLARLSWLHILAKYKQETCKQDISKDIIAEDNKNDFARSESDRFYAAQNKSQEELFKEIHLNKHEGKSYYQDLGRFYIGQGRFQDAEKCFEKALKLGPGDSNIYRELGETYYVLCKIPEAQDCFLKSLESNPKDVFACNDLAVLYRDGCENKFKESERYFKKAIELDQKRHFFYYELGCLYSKQQYLAEAQKCLIKAIELSGGRDVYYGALAEIYGKMGKDQLSKEQYEKANKFRLSGYMVTTRDNFIKLKRILDRRKIKFICVQYPVRNIHSLKKIFEGKKGVVFVDNERVFKRALRASRYEDYFHDMFGGDFGHCTPKGNRLLAENIAKVALRECLK